MVLRTFIFSKVVGRLVSQILPLLMKLSGNGLNPKPLVQPLRTVADSF